MAELFPFRFFPIGDRYVTTNDAGDFFLASQAFLDRMVTDCLSQRDEHFLLEAGFAFEHEDDFYWHSHSDRLKSRKYIPGRLTYIIAIPTLRCDLMCRYCQVSRADVSAIGYDWSDQVLTQFLRFIDEETAGPLKIEFQGGEPTLRLDLIRRVIDHCRASRRTVQYVICTNLSNISSALLEILEDPDVFVSTSLDGAASTHRVNRTQTEEATAQFFANLDLVRGKFGADKVSALPTMTSLAPADIEELIAAYISQGFTSIYLRPVNYQGFARKKFPDSRTSAGRWKQAYRDAIHHIFQHNIRNDPQVREAVLELALARVFHPSSNGHVDLRSPNPTALDYVVVDFDGRLYPSDEARMLARIGRHDLSIGSLAEGRDIIRVRAMSWNQMNEVHEDCIHCAFQPYCGIDTIDDLSRYDRIDMPKHITWFCAVHKDLFAFLFEMLLRGNPNELMNISGHLTGRFENTPICGSYIYD